MSFLSRALRALERWGDEKALAGTAASSDAAVADFLHDVLARFPYTDEAKEWLTTAIGFEVQDLSSHRGGGYWIPDQNEVFLFTGQYEAAIHELAHAWWHYRRAGNEERMIEATVCLAGEKESRYARLAGLAHGYVYGIPEQNWPGLLVDRNDWEMYASLASGMMADMRLAPPYIRAFYEGMYYLLPDEALSPARLAPHG